MHPAQIQAALKMRGYTQAGIASEFDKMTQATIWQVIHSRTRSKRVEMKIAEITGFPLATLWPDWYGPNAARKRKEPAMTKAQVIESFRALAS